VHRGFITAFHNYSIAQILPGVNCHDGTPNANNPLPQKPTKNGEKGEIDRFYRRNSMPGGEKKPQLRKNGLHNEEKTKN